MLTIAGTEFNTRDEFKRFCKKLNTDARKNIIEEAAEKGLSWKRSSEYKVDWMRAAMKIGETIEKSFKEKVKEKQETLKIDVLLGKLGLKTKVENNVYTVGKGVTRGENKWGKIVVIEGVRFAEIVKKPKIGPGNWIKLELSFNDKELVKSIGGEWGGKVEDADRNWYVPFRDFLKIVDAFKDVEIAPSVSPTIAAVMEKATEEDMERLIESLSTERVLVKNDEDIDISDFVLPQGIKGIDPYSHQKKAYKFTLLNKKVVIGLAVGLGKTLTAILAIKELLNSKKIKRAVVVCPASVKYNWKQEIEAFSDMKVCVIEASDLRGVRKGPQTWEAAKKANIIIVNYDILRNEKARNRIFRLAPNCVIADEAHKLKNNTQQTAGFAATWGASAEYVWFLSATPFPNGKPRETYNMLRHLRPERVNKWSGGPLSFGSRFVDWETKPIMLRNLDKLKEEMKDIVFIRTQNSPDVTAELPKERHNTFFLEMETEQKKLYNTVLDQVIAEIVILEKKGISAGSPNILSQMKRLEQVAIDPDMLKKSDDKVDMNRLYPKEEWAVNSILEHLADPENRGVVLFCDMKLPLAKVKHNLIVNGIDESKIAYITGDIKNRDRTEVQTKFKNGELQVVLCTSAGEEGVNLQHGAHTLIHLDVPWVPKSITQREGRVLRQGQPNPFSQFLTPIIKNTVEDVKRGKIGMKVSVIEDLLGSGSAGSSVGYIESQEVGESLTFDDIRSILQKV